MDAGALLDVEGLSVVFNPNTEREVTAVTDVNLSLRENEYLALIGPSGCGKSTVLHSVGGLLKPTSGVVRDSDGPITSPSPKFASFAFQQASLLPWKKIVDNVSLGLRFSGHNKRYAIERAEKELSFVGLEGFNDAHPHELSGGMQQRAALARALCMDPKLLLLDEPFGALDEFSRRSLGVEMSKTLAMREQSLILVTHSLEEAIFWADRILIMSARPGRVTGEICVNVPRPRGVDFMASAEFGKLRAELFEIMGLAPGPATYSESL